MSASPWSLQSQDCLVQSDANFPVLSFLCAAPFTEEAGEQNIQSQSLISLLSYPDFSADVLKLITSRFLFLKLPPLCTAGSCCLIPCCFQFLCIPPIVVFVGSSVTPAQIPWSCISDQLSASCRTDSFLQFNTVNPSGNNERFLCKIKVMNRQGKAWHWIKSWLKMYEESRVESCLSLHVQKG